MSTQPEMDFADDALSDEAVHDYLIANPDFFDRHKSLLSTLDLPHAAGGAVSLVERQVSVLRQKELKLERKLRDLIAVARDNDLLTARIHALSLQLLAADSLNGTIEAIEEGLRSGFSAELAVLVHFGDPEAFTDVEGGRFFRVIARDNDELGAFRTFLDGKSPRCGQVRDSQRDFLFRQHAEDIGSVALVPLGEASSLGFLAVGSADADRFHPGMSVDFLSRLGELIAGALQRF